VTDERIEVVPWRDDELVVISEPNHPLAARRRVRLDDLASEPFIVRERGSGTREVAERALAFHGARLTVAMQLASTEAIKQAVAAGLGLAIVSRSAIDDQLALGRIAVVPLTGVALERALTELRVVDRPPTAAADAFRTVLAV
jgi:DNA-binding transcriptional LysR family regulator